MRICSRPALTGTRIERSPLCTTTSRLDPELVLISSRRSDPLALGPGTKAAVRPSTPSALFTTSIADAAGPIQKNGLPPTSSSPYGLITPIRMDQVGALGDHNR